MDGIDALVFTGGVGEHAAAIRARAAGGLAFLGVELDPARNDDPELDAEVGAAGAPVSTFVVRAREDLQIARDVRGLFASSRLS